MKTIEELRALAIQSDSLLRDVISRAKSVDASCEISSILKTKVSEPIYTTSEIKEVALKHFLIIKDYFNQSIFELLDSTGTGINIAQFQMNDFEIDGYEWFKKLIEDVNAVICETDYASNKAAQEINEAGGIDFVCKYHFCDQSRIIVNQLKSLQRIVSFDFDLFQNKDWKTKVTLKKFDRERLSDYLSSIRPV